jgi:hypothetical protein
VAAEREIDIPVIVAMVIAPPATSEWEIMVAMVSISPIVADLVSNEETIALVPFPGPVAVIAITTAVSAVVARDHIALGVDEFTIAQAAAAALAASPTSSLRVVIAADELVVGILAAIAAASVLTVVIVLAVTTSVRSSAASATASVIGGESTNHIVRRVVVRIDQCRTIAATATPHVATTSGRTILCSHGVGRICADISAAAAADKTLTIVLRVIVGLIILIVAQVKLTAAPAAHCRGVAATARLR